MINHGLIKTVEESYAKVFEDLKVILLDSKFFNIHKGIENYECTQNFEIAMQLYMDQDPDSIYSSYPDLIADPPTEVKWDIKVWQKINEQTELEIKKIGENYTQNERWELIREISMKNDWWNLGDLAGFVYSDFINILAFYAYKLWSADEIESLFLEEQYKVYSKGGFPYGWKGNYPEGEILVFLPMKSKKYLYLDNFRKILEKIS